MITPKLVSWILAAVVMSVGVVTWCYATFETKEVGIERKEDIIKRLDTMDGKLNTLLERKGQ
jgi:hypothetical protein